MMFYHSRMIVGPSGRVQIEPTLRRRNVAATTLPEHVLRLAQAEYEHHYGTSQDYERIQQRGGFGLLEIVFLLADYVVRLGGTPTKPRIPATEEDNGDQ